MPDEPINFDSVCNRDNLEAAFAYGANEGRSKPERVCARCGGSGARLIAEPDFALCPECERVEGGRALGK